MAAGLRCVVVDPSDEALMLTRAQLGRMKRGTLDEKICEVRVV